jgi:hypothetical protein
MKVYLHAFFYFGTRWRWVVSFIPRQLYPRERAPGILEKKGVKVWIGFI